MSEKQPSASSDVGQMILIMVKRDGWIKTLAKIGGWCVLLAVAAFVLQMR